MKQKTRIRRATANDMEAIFRLVCELAEYEKAPDEVITDATDYASEFRKGTFDALVADSGDEVVGMVLFFIVWSTWKGRMLFLEDFVVKRGLRGQGVGQKLFDALIDHAREEGCSLLKWQVLDWNEPALRFYRKYDAVIEKEWWNGKLFL